MKKLYAIVTLLGCLVTSTSAATSYDMSKGIDLTGQASVSASMLNQLVDNATVSANRGMIIYTNTAPSAGVDILNNPRLSRFIWLDSSVEPPAIYTYNTNTTTWTAIGLAPNSVLSSHITDGTIAAADLGAASVTSSKLDTNSVSTAAIIDGAVTAAKIGTDQVTTTEIKDGTVGAIDLATDSVTSAAILESAVTTAELGLSAVTLTNLAALSVGTTNFVADAVDTAAITNLAVTAAKIGVTTGSAFDVMRVNSAGTAAEWSHAGRVLQRVYANFSSATNFTSVIPYDDTIPQSGEGTEIVSVSFTPKSDTSTIYVDFAGIVTGDATRACIIALFDGNANAISASGFTATSSGMSPAALKHAISSWGLSAKTFSINAGNSAGGTLYWNQNNSGQTLGGMLNSIITITEIQ